MPSFRLLLPLALAVLFAACDGRKPAGSGDAADGEPLPQPAAAGGPVTGMPAPGASTPDPGRIATDPVADDAHAATDTPAAQAEPGADAAVAVLRDYYAAINARDFPRAYALWRQNPQAPAQFADGFAGTTGVSVEIGTPGAIDAGAGQRYVEIPVRLDATQADGRIDRYAGSYVLHRSVVDGGDPAWRIERATLAKQ